MNFSQKHFLLFTFLKCNVVYLCSWTARIKAFIPGDRVQGEIEGERERQEGGGGVKRKSSKRVRSSLRVTFSVPFHCLCEYITGN